MACASGVAQTGTTSTTSTANQLLITGFSINIGGSSNGVASLSNSFTIVDQLFGTNVDILLGERIVSATGTFSTTITWNNPPPAGFGSAGAIITLQAAADVPTTPPEVFFNAEYDFIQSETGVQGRAYELEMSDVGDSFAYNLNRKEDITFIDYYDIVPVENTQNQGQFMETTTGDMLIKFQGDEIVAID